MNFTLFFQVIFSVKLLHIVEGRIINVLLFPPDYYLSDYSLPLIPQFRGI